MKPQNLMLLFCFAFILLGCKKDVEIIIPCQKKVDLGEFPLSDSARNLISFPVGISVQYLFDINNEDSIKMTINPPAYIDDQIIWKNRSSNCEATNVENEYTYIVEEKLAYIFLERLDEPLADVPSTVFRISSVFEEVENTINKVGEFFALYGLNNLPLVNNEAIFFLDRMFVTLSGKETQPDLKYILHSSIELNNETFLDIYETTGDLTGFGYVDKLYISLEKGIVGVADDEGKTWTIN